MLSDHDLKALREIERRLRAESPELIRLFHSVEPRSATSRHKQARARVLVFAVAFTGLALVGPRVLNDAEIRAQKSPPLPRRSPPYATTTRRTGPVPDPGAAVVVPAVDTHWVIDLPTSCVTVSCNGNAQNAGTAVPAIEDPNTPRVIGPFRRLEGRDGPSAGITSQQSSTTTDRRLRRNWRTS
ncbi:MAG: DUF3040 domain-containing protein [Mycobacterium sp.]